MPLACLAGVEALDDARFRGRAQSLLAGHDVVDAPLDAFVLCEGCLGFTLDAGVVDAKSLPSTKSLAMPALPSPLPVSARARLRRRLASSRAQKWRCHQSAPRRVSTSHLDGELVSNVTRDA